MAPAKRKRNDRSSVDAGDSRPSPHRPQNTNLGQHERGADMRDAGNRRSSRGGQGGAGAGRGRRNDNRDMPNKLNVSTTGRATPTPGPMSPPPPRPSSASQTPIQTPTPNSDPFVTLPKPDPAPFDYDFLTDERLASWDANGRQEVITIGTQARQDEDAMDLASIFQELVRATLDGRIDPTDAGSCAKEILGPDTTAEDDAANFDPKTFFLDTISMIYDAEEGPTNPALRIFAAATGVSPVIMRQKLDGKLLQDLGLTRDTFIRVGVRQATNLLYRQANYNLLREETEGYSKLVTELFTTSGSEPPSSEVVEDTFERVKGLIGTFDLDVGRVLDITLDVFAAVLIKHFRFFIRLLRVSSWWPRSGEADTGSGGLPTWALPSSTSWTPTEEDEKLSRQHRRLRDEAFWPRAREVGLDAFFELGGRQILDEATRKRILGGKDHDTEFDADRQWIEETGTLPPSGNRVAAQLLGFKLRFYTSAARDKEDVLPSNLIYLTALLIKIGFISLRDLYPHLWPLDEAMPAVREARMKELAEKERLNRPGGGATNALTMAGALSDDTLPNNGRTRDSGAVKADPIAKSTADIDDKTKLDEPTDQKVQLLVCLLTIGAIPESLFILGRFPWLPEAYPELIDLINRILNYSIKDVYERCQPSAQQDAECLTKKVPDVDQNNMPKGSVRLAQLPTRKLLRWPFPDKCDTNDNLSYRFYWDEWADNVPVCQNVDDIFTLCGTLLNIAGVNIGKDSSLLSKLARIGIKSLVDDSSQDNLDRWQDLLRRMMVPALSLTKANTAVVNEIYDMLRMYSLPVRYSIYAEWFEGPTSRLPAMQSAFARARLETLSTMKRISKTNLTAMARTLSKTAFSSPGVVFKIALSQIEAYTNLTEVVVECAKYFTDLGYDVLVWSLLSALGGKDRNRTNAEFALLPSRWLLALSTFSGKVFKRYGIMNLAPIIQYVNDQLYRGNSTDLVILKELVSQMAGIVPDTDFTDAQLLAMTGGEVLRRQTLINLQDKRFESTKTAKRLMKPLVDTKLAGELLISIAQHRQSAIYKIADEEAHIKMLATMIDDTQSILFQYLDLLRSNLSVEEFDNHVPGILELMADFGLDPALAFMIGRAGLAYRISKVPYPVLNGNSKADPISTSRSVDAEGDLGMEDVISTQANGDQISTQIPHVGSDSTGQDDSQMIDIVEETTSGAEEQPADPLREILEPIIEGTKSALPEGTFKCISPEFYVTFWTTTLGDLSVPGPSYDLEIARLSKQQEEIVKDRSDMSRQGMAKKDGIKKNLIETRANLLAELKKLLTGFTKAKGRLLMNKSIWFGASIKPDEVSDAILEKCLVPRILLSPSDADFCFRMIKFLHDNGVPYFRTLSLYGRIFRTNRLRSIIFTCTVREAENLGRFLRLVLSDLARWHVDAAVYEKEAWGTGRNLPGFAKALNDDGKPKGFIGHDGSVHGFKSILLHWHQSLNSALRDCLNGTEWMHIRNAITILKSVVEVFPTIDFMGNSFIAQLELIATREKGVREDLALTGNAVLVQLKKRSKKWIMIQAFRHNTVEAGQANGSPGSHSNATKSTLKPTAQEFKPQSRASSLGASTPKPSTAEVEDGEVDDTKSSISSKNVTKQSLTSSDASETKPAPPAVVPTIESKRSEILDRREQIKREQAAKAALSPRDSAAPPRPDISTRNPIPDRASPNLPIRPDAPFPGRSMLDRHPSRHGDRRDARDSRLPDSRLDRPGDWPGERPRDYSSSDRRGMEPSSRDFSRSSDRLGDRDRIRPDPPPRWTPDSARENAERSINGSRPTDTGRLSRDMAPPRSSGPPSDRGSAVSADRQPPATTERQELVNPERAALMSGENDVSRSESPRRGREEPRDRGTSRPQSPRRHAPEMDYPDPRRDERAARNGIPESYNVSRNRNEDIHPPPAGPRSDRAVDRPGERNSSDRSAFQPPQSLPRSIDPDHGRLNAGSRQQSDPNFGRLNPTPTPDIPSGPRDRNSRGGRMGNVQSQPPRRDGRVSDMPRPPTPEKQPPTGPSSGRHSRRAASGQFDPTSITPSAPTTPVTASPSSGVHPDRLKQLGPTVQPPQSQPTNTVSAPPIHPDRLKGFENESPDNLSPTSPFNNNRSRPHVPPLATTGPPLGPKAPQASPVGPGTNGLAAPTGPASATERARGGRRQIAGINTIIQQVGQQNAHERMNVRGRGRMSSGLGPETPISAPSTPIVPPPPPPPGPAPARQESVNDGGRDIVNPERGDLITGNTLPNEDRDRERGGRRERSGRHSRRSSRSPGRERDLKRGIEDDRSREYRDRRDTERDRHQGRIPATDLLPGREPGRDRERERESGRRDGRERDSAGREPHEAGWIGERGTDRPSERGGSSRSRDIRGEERRDGRGNRDSEGGRKRRSDEGGMDSRGHDKRVRR